MSNEIKKTVLFICHGLPPESYGGVEVYTQNLYNSFKLSEEYAPLLLSRTNHGKFWPNLIWADTTDPNKFFINTPYNDIFNLTNKESDDFFREFLINTQPDVIHFQHYLHLSLSWFKIARQTLPNAKIILTAHEYMAICPNSGQMIKTKWQGNLLCHKSSVKDCSACFPYIPKDIIRKRREIVKEAFKYVDIFTGPSQFIKDRYVDFGVPKNKFIVSENGQRIVSIPRKRIADNHKLRLLYLGQINRFKGLQVLLKAMKLLTEESVELNIHGKFQQDEEYKSAILKTIDQLPNVHFNGEYSQANLQVIFAKNDILVVPSIWWENSPLVIQEAFMAKLPVICSNIGGMAEKVKNGQNGLHFSVNSHVDLAKKIKQLLKSPELLTNFIDQIDAVKSIDENRDELVNIYNEI